MNQYKIVYGIRDDITYPCFARLIYECADKFYLQVEYKEKIGFERIELENNDELIHIEYNSDQTLDFKQPIYCVMFSVDDIFIGSKKQLHDELYDKVSECSLFFRERFNSLIDNPWQLLIIYKEMQCSKYSKCTRAYAKTHYSEVIKEIIDALDKLSLVKKKKFDEKVLVKKSPLDVMECFYASVVSSFRSDGSKGVRNLSGVILSPNNLGGTLRIKIPAFKKQRVKQQARNNKTLKKNKFVDSILQCIE